MWTDRMEFLFVASKAVPVVEVGDWVKKLKLMEKN